MRKIKLEVTQRDIDRSIKLYGRGDSCECPVALALKRVIKKQSVKVYDCRDDRIEVEINDYTYTGKSNKISKFIKHFDHGGDVRPFKENLILILTHKPT